MWNDVQGNKILVYLASDRPVVDTAGRMGRIRDLLKVLFPSSTIAVGCATPHKENRAPAFKPVFPYLISGLTDFQKDALLSRRVWSIKTLTIFTIPFDPPVSRYALTLTGIFLEDPSKEAHTVVDAVRKTLASTPRIQMFLEDHNDNIDGSITNKLSFILDSITVRGAQHYIGNSKRPVFFVYIHPPTTSPRYHRDWLTRLQRLKYGTTCGIGSHIAKEWRCNLCKGIDHLTAFCRFPALPGWNLPPTFASEEEEENPDNQPPSRHSNTPEGRPSRSGRRGNGRREHRN
ncbi:hypothetical protein AX17_004356 [Amanita inopinata Kibby_2008]|nr:hypothetical protein AX17_004356 [Amanita inopinata Kibby_2008]